MTWLLEVLLLAAAGSDIGVIECVLNFILFLTCLLGREGKNSPIYIEYRKLRISDEFDFKYFVKNFLNMTF